MDLGSAIKPCPLVGLITGLSPPLHLRDLPPCRSARSRSPSGLVHFAVGSEGEVIVTGKEDREITSLQMTRYLMKDVYMYTGTVDYG